MQIAFMKETQAAYQDHHLIFDNLLDKDEFFNIPDHKLQILDIIC